MCYICVVYIFLYNDFDFLIFLTFYRKKKRAVKMMITIVLLFTICWAPFHTVHMLFEYCKHCLVH